MDEPQEQRALLRVEKVFESGLELPEGTPIFVTEYESGWCGAFYPDPFKTSSHVFAISPDEFTLLVRARAATPEPIEGDPVCPHCGSARREGTGLFECGEGLRGNVGGGCRVFDTARLIRSQRAELDAYRKTYLDKVLVERGRILLLAENLFQMIPPEIWRDHGGDDGQGHYEGDYRAEQVQHELVQHRAGTWKPDE